MRLDLAYMVVKQGHNSAGEFYEEVTFHLESGWDLSGGISFDFNGGMAQALSKPMTEVTGLMDKEPRFQVMR